MLAFLLPFVLHYGAIFVLGLILTALLVAWRGELGFLLAAILIVACGALVSCGPSEAEKQREAAINAEVSRSLIESKHHWQPSGSMTGPGNH